MVTVQQLQMAQPFGKISDARPYSSGQGILKGI